MGGDAELAGGLGLVDAGGGQLSGAQPTGGYLPWPSARSAGVGPRGSADDVAELGGHLHEPLGVDAGVWGDGMGVPARAMSSANPAGSGMWW